MLGTYVAEDAQAADTKAHGPSSSHQLTALVEALAQKGGTAWEVGKLRAPFQGFGHGVPRGHGEGKHADVEVLCSQCS